MRFWKKIKTEKDIATLMDSYYGFHDACIVSVSYKSGTTVHPERKMHFSGENGHRMRVLFHSQTKKKKLELLFVGLRQARLVGWQECCTCELYDAHLSIKKGLLPGKAKQQIVWASHINFDIENIDNTISEPASTYIISNELSWRLI